MIKCEDCISFAICIHKIKVGKYVPLIGKAHYSMLSIFDTHEIENCLDFYERFKNRDKQSNEERDKLKKIILQMKGLEFVEVERGYI